MRKCKSHPRYKAVRKPRCNCIVCWGIWWEFGTRKG